MSEGQKSEEVKGSWVQDAGQKALPKLISEITLRNIKHSPKGSGYVIGPSRSGKSGEQGIYFQDPTAQPAKEGKIISTSQK